MRSPSHWSCFCVGSLRSLDQVHRGEDIEHVSTTLPASPVQIACQWSGFAEPTSSILSYRWAIATEAMTDGYAASFAASSTSRLVNTSFETLTNWTDVDASTTFVAVHVPVGLLRPQVTYKCVVRARNSVGDLSAVAISDGFSFDQSEPTGGTQRGSEP